MTRSTKALEDNEGGVFYERHVMVLGVSQSVPDTAANNLCNTRYEYKEQNYDYN